MNKSIFALLLVCVLAGCNSDDGDKEPSDGGNGNVENPDSGNGSGEDGDGSGEDGDGSGEDGDGSGEDGDGSGEDGDGSGEDGDGSGEDGDGSGEDGSNDPVNQPEYYTNVSGLSGADLKGALRDIISTDVQFLTYTEVWYALQYTDQDPENEDNVILLYTGRSAYKDDRVGQTGDDNDSWNREHVFPKSYGFKSSSQYGYTDIHHLRPTDMTVNSARGNKHFDNGGSANGEAPDTFADGDSWEPRDEVKGDVARMIFYMDVRYDGSSGNMPDLQIVNHTNGATGEPYIGKLCTLVEWHDADPVNDFEARRNDRIQERQGNRNPFIDNPQWVESLWGASCP